MSMSIIGYPVALGNLAEAVKIATDAGIRDYNVVELEQTLEQAAAAESYWSHIVVDDEGDVLLGRGAIEVADTLEEWKQLVNSVA